MVDSGLRRNDGVWIPAYDGMAGLGFWAVLNYGVPLVNVIPS